MSRAPQLQAQMLHQEQIKTEQTSQLLVWQDPDAVVLCLASTIQSLTNRNKELENQITRYNNQNKKCEKDIDGLVEQLKISTNDLRDMGNEIHKRDSANNELKKQIRNLEQQ